MLYIAITIASVPVHLFSLFIVAKQLQHSQKGIFKTARDHMRPYKLGGL